MWVLIRHSLAPEIVLCKSNTSARNKMRELLDEYVDGDNGCSANERFDALIASFGVAEALHLLDGVDFEGMDSGITIFTRHLEPV